MHIIAIAARQQHKRVTKLNGELRIAPLLVVQLDQQLDALIPTAEAQALLQSVEPHSAKMPIPAMRVILPTSRMKFTAISLSLSSQDKSLNKSNMNRKSKHYYQIQRQSTLKLQMYRTCRITMMMTTKSHTSLQQDYALEMPRTNSFSSACWIPEELIL
jgi:hypothetical protein